MKKEKSPSLLPPVHPNGIEIFKVIRTGETLPIVDDYGSPCSTRKLHTKRSTLTTTTGSIQIIWTIRAFYEIKAQKLSIDLCIQQHYHRKNEKEKEK